MAGVEIGWIANGSIQIQSRNEGDPMANTDYPEWEIRPAHVADRSAVSRILDESGLPTDELDLWIDSFVVAECQGMVIGVAGLEPHGTCAVLRSVAVTQSHRGEGLGSQLVTSAIANARDQGMRHLYLLTTTAAGYFPRHGFRPIPREEAPDEILKSVEFREACPDSAVAMTLDLSR